MARYIYIISDINRNNLHVGLCSDLLKTLDFYEQMPTLFFSPEQMLNTLLYFERFNDADAAMERYKAVCTFIRPKKEQLISSVNPEFNDIRNLLTPSTTKGGE